MWPALKTSALKSTPSFWKARYLWIVIAALVLAVVLYSVVRITDSGKEGETLSPAPNRPIDEAMIGLKPASFQQISEFKDGATKKIRLSGDAEPGAAIIITNRGERLRQVLVNDLGQWGVTLDVDENGMALEAVLYKTENAVGIRSEETIFRIPVPENEELATSNYTTDALIMVTAPGRPSRIIQSPFGGVPTSGPLGLSVIDYDYAGGVIITGTSSMAGRVRIFAQDAQIGETGIGVGGRWNFIAGRMLPRGEIEIRAELIPAPGFVTTQEGPTSLSVPFKFLPPLRQDETGGGGALTVNFEPLQWQVRRTLIGGGGQSTVIFSPDAAR